MKWPAAIQCVACCFLAVLHVYWAFGGTFWVKNVVPEVNGAPAFEPGMAATLTVATGLFGCAGIAAALGANKTFTKTRARWLRAAGMVLAGVFILRAIGDFRLVGFFKPASDSAFGKYDLLVYSPVSLVMGFGFAFLARRMKRGDASP